MNKLLHGFLLVLLMALGTILPVEQAKASHYVGSDITFGYTGTPGWYLLRVNFYRDCGGITPGGVQVTATIPGCTTLTINFTDANDLNNITDASEVCEGQLTECTTPANNNIPGIEVYEYAKLVNLGTACSGQWTFTFDGNARNDDIINLLNGNSQVDWWTDAGLNTANPGQPNNSPIFSSSPVPYVCLNDTVQYNPQVTDPDGDSLVYSLVAARSSNGNPITYTGGYTPQMPFGVTAYTVLDPVTGQFNFKPTIVGTFVVVIKVEEWRTINGTPVMIGYVHRDVQVQVIACNSVPPVLSNLTLTGGGQAPISFPPNVIQEVQACVPYCITIPATTLQPGATLVMNTNAANEIPNSTFTVVGEGTNSVTGTLCFEANPALAGQEFSFTVGVSDDVCPIPNKFVRAFTIKVIKETGFTVAASEDSICVNTPVQLSATPRANTSPLTSPEYLGFSWAAVNLQGQPVQGYFQGGNNTTLTPTVTPKATTRYILSSQTTYGCTDTASVVVYVKGIQPTIQNVVPATATICQGQTTTLTATVVGPTGLQLPPVWTYSWFPNVNNPNAAIPTVEYAGIDTATYTVIVSNGMCSDTGTVTVNFVPGAIPNITSNLMSVCVGDTIQLNATSTGPGSAGSTYSWISGDRINNADSTSTFALPATVGISPYVIQVTTPTGCVVTDTLNIQVNGVRPNLVDFPPSITLCQDQTSTISPNINFDPIVADPQATYLWTPSTGLSDPTSANPTISYTGDNSVDYIFTVASGGCTDSTSVTVNFVPSISIAPSATPTTLCLGDTVDLRAVFTPGNVLGANITWLGSGVNNVNDSVTYAIPQNTGVQPYDVQITLSQNCSFSASISVNVEGVRPNITSLSGAPSPICFGETTVLAATVEPSLPSTPAPNIVYAWSANNAGGGIENPDQLTTNANPEGTTVYTFTASDNGTCQVQESVTIEVGEQVNLSYSVTYNPDSLAAVSETTPLTVTFTNNTTTAGPVDSVKWILTNVNDPSAAPIVLNGNSGSATIEFTENSQYNVVMYVYTPFGCVYELQKPLWIGAFIVPNVITPNGDGVNDEFVITNLKPNTKVYVVNRWGKTIAEFGQGGKWSPGSDVPTGIYFYSVDEKNTGRTYKGWVELLR